jgi:hypothetical protein
MELKAILFSLKLIKSAYFVIKALCGVIEQNRKKSSLGSGWEKMQKNDSKE